MISCVSPNYFYWQALLAEGRFWSDLELTEKEIERMVMEASRAEYLASNKLRKQPGIRDSSTSSAEPSSSGGSKNSFFPPFLCVVTRYFPSAHLDN